MKNLTTYTDYYNNVLDVATKKGKIPSGGGSVRATTGHLVESLAELIWKTETNGTVKRKTYDISNPQGDKLGFSVDKHCYAINDELKLILECKAYLDRCFLARADHDLGMIKRSMGQQNRNVKFAILALENATTEDAIKFYKGHDNIDDIFFLLDGKRKSSEPIWKPKFRKNINPQLLQEFVKYAQNLA